MGDWESWDNRPSTHIAPDSIADRFREDERRKDRDRRVFWVLVIAAMLLTCFWAGFKY